MKRNNLRIAICSSGAGQIFRGIEKWSHDMDDLLSERNVAHTFFKGGGKALNPNEKVLWCLKRTAPLSKLLARAFSKIGGWRYGLGGEVQIEQTTFLISLLFELRRNKFQIIHTQEYHLASYLDSLKKRDLIGAKVILVHGTNEPNEALMQFEFVQHSSPFELERRKLEGCYRPKWTAIPNFVYTEKYKPIQLGEKAELKKKYGLPDDTTILLTVSAIKKTHKRIDWLIEEISLLKKISKDFLWLVIGGREQETDEIIAMGKKRLGNNIMFLIDVPHNQMPELYQCADFFVLGSLREMCSIALIEAISSGLVVFVNNHPVLKYIAGKGGIVVDMASHGELACNIEKILGKEDLIQKKSRLVREHAIRFFSKDVVFQQTIDYYSQILS